MDLRSGQIYTWSGTGRVLHRKQICNQCVLQEVLTCGSMCFAFITYLQMFTHDAMDHIGSESIVPKILGWIFSYIMLEESDVPHKMVCSFVS